MTIESSELFELCKQAYEVTGWTNGGFLYEFSMNAASGSNVVFPAGRTPNAYPYDNTVYPLYTSDYLLEKLPVYSEDAEGMLSVTTRQGYERNGWMAYYEDVDGYSVGAEGIGKSPLEALLRLTLNLYEEGLL